MLGIPVTAVLTYIETRRKLITDLTREYDLALRAERLTAYRKLWNLLRPLHPYARQPLAVSEARALSATLSDWYASEGFLLSLSSWREYGVLQRGLASIGADEPGRILDEDELDLLGNRTERLQNSLTEEIGTRERSALRSQPVRRRIMW